MDALQNLKIDPNQAFNDTAKLFETEFDSRIEAYDKGLKWNRKLNIVFTSLSIILTLATAIAAVVGDANTISFNQKLLVGILAAASVAVQTAASQFAVAQKTKTYLELRNEVTALRIDLESAATVDDLKQLKAPFLEILKKETAIP